MRPLGLAGLLAEGGRGGGRADGSDRDRFSGKACGESVTIMNGASGLSAERGHAPE